MKVLIVGGGGREHAIAMCVSKSAKCEKLYCAPGNAGIAGVAECAPIGAMEFDKLVAFAKEKEIDFVIVGMDDPLVGGLVDKMEEAGIKIRALSDYYHENREDRHCLVVNYSGIKEEELEKALEALKSIM